MIYNFFSGKFYIATKKKVNNLWMIYQYVFFVKLRRFPQTTSWGLQKNQQMTESANRTVTFQGFTVLPLACCFYCYRYIFNLTLSLTDLDQNAIKLPLV